MDPVRGTSNSPGSSPTNSPSQRRRTTLSQSTETPLTGPVEGAVGGPPSAQLVASLEAYPNDALKVAADTSFSLSLSGNKKSYDYKETKQHLNRSSNTCSEACLTFIHQRFFNISDFHPINPHSPAHCESIDLNAALERAPTPPPKNACENPNPLSFKNFVAELKNDTPYIMRIGSIGSGHHIILFKDTKNGAYFFDPSTSLIQPRGTVLYFDKNTLGQGTLDTFKLIPTEGTPPNPIHAYEISHGNLSFLSHFCKVHRCQSEAQAEAAFPLPRPAGSSPEPEADKARRLVALSNAQFSPEVLFSDILRLKSLEIPKIPPTDEECIRKLKEDDLTEILKDEEITLKENPNLKEEIKSLTTQILGELSEKEYSLETITTKKAQIMAAPLSPEDLHSLASTTSTPTLHLLLKEDTYGVKELCLLSLSENRWELFTKDGLVPLLRTGAPPDLSPFESMKLQIAALNPGHLQTLENIHASNTDRNAILNTHKEKEIKERTKDIQARQQKLIATQTLQPRGEGPDDEAENVALVKRYEKAKEEERKRAEGTQGPLPGATASAAIDFSPFNNTCSEESLLCAAAHYRFPVPDLEPRNYSQDNQENRDVQLDFGNALGILNRDIPGLNTKEIAQNGKNKEGIAGFLNSLNKNLCHLVRTGKNAGPGHFSVLYFKNGEWWNHENRKYTDQKMTHAEGQLTEEGKQKFVVAHGSWGRKSDDYNLVVTPFPKNEDIFMTLAQFINMSRECTDEDSRNALLMLFMTT